LGINVGGLNVSIGIDVSNLQKGISSTKNMLDNFQRQLASISLEGIVKGNPFKSINKYLETTKSSINTVFSQWAMAIKSTNIDMGSVAAKARKNAERVVLAWDEIARGIRKNKSIVEKAVREILEVEDVQKFLVFLHEGKIVKLE